MQLLNREYLRSIIFGIEDSLVSTTGLIAGLSVGTDDKKVVVLGGLIAIFIEAVSMGAGEYLSDDAVHDLDKLKRSREKPFVSGLLMLISYLIAGFFPLAPIFFLPLNEAIHLSVIIALVGLFVLGYSKGKILHTAALRGALKILLVGGFATGLGIAVGYIFKIS